MKPLWRSAPAWCVLLLGWCLSHAPAAAVTLNNYDGIGTAHANEITHHDSGGNKVEIHSGNILQVGSAFYAYGEYHGCGFRVGTTSPWCGFRVYSSTDLKHWYDQGYLFDGGTAYWQNRCQGQDNTYNGCYRPKMVYNAANNNFVFWFNQYGGSPAATDALFVFTCTTPTGGCTNQPDPTGIAHGPTGDENLFVDSGGTAYLIYSNISTREVWIDELNAAYTDSTGTTVDTGGNGEAVWMFQRSGTYYAGYGALCGYCVGGADTTYRSASSALGSYGSATTLNSTSCNGQNRGVDVITASGNTTYLYSADQWVGGPNEGLANVYFQPLSFAGSAINTYSCNATVTVPGLVEQPYPPASPPPDQTDVQDGFHDLCDITSSNYRFFTFVPTATQVSAISLPLGQNNTGCTVASAGCTGVNGNLTVSLTSVSGGNAPGSVLASGVVTGTALPWSTRWTRVNFSAPVAVTPSVPYGVEIQGANSAACFTLARSTSTLYTAGVESVSANSGSSWSPESASIMFASYSVPDLMFAPTRMMLLALLHLLVFVAGAGMEHASVLLVAWRVGRVRRVRCGGHSAVPQIRLPAKPSANRPVAPLVEYQPEMNIDASCLSRQRAAQRHDQRRAL